MAHSKSNAKSNANLNTIQTAPASIAATIQAVPTTLTPETPFFPFKPDFPTWKGDLAYTSGDYVLLNAPTETIPKTIDPLKDKAQPIVFMSLKVIKELQYITERAASKTGECACMLLSKPLSQKDERHILVYDYFLARQDASGAHVSLDMEDVNKYTTYLKNTYPDQWTNNPMSENLQHWHSHANMPVFNSGTDINQQENPTELGFQSRHRFFLIFNTMKQVRCTMVMYAPIFQRIENVLVGIYTGDGVPAYPGLTKERKAAIDNSMDSLIKPPAPRYVAPAWDAAADYSRGWKRDAISCWPEYAGLGDKPKHTPNTNSAKRVTEEAQAHKEFTLDPRAYVMKEVIELLSELEDSMGGFDEEEVTTNIEEFMELFLGTTNIEGLKGQQDLFMESVLPTIAMIHLNEDYEHYTDNVYEELLGAATTVLNSLTTLLNYAETQQKHPLFQKMVAYATTNYVPLIDILCADHVSGAYGMLLDLTRE